MHSHARPAFTLIELLIVVAIIAILAAIAVPNFLEAQVRAKSSRAKNDCRVIATALEAYYVDNNDYPYIQADGGPGIEWQAPYGFPPTMSSGPGGLTTPVAYITSALRDPFELESENGDTLSPAGVGTLYYERLGWGYDALGNRWNDNGANARAVRVCVDGNGTLNGTAPDFNTTDRSLVPVRYVVYSVGPDKTHRVYAPDGSLLVRSRFSILNRYDPTNGTISPGNIARYADSMVTP
jgi:prepilin-type N-terminal cleavage/methylation domain-containing protein